MTEFEFFLNRLEATKATKDTSIKKKFFLSFVLCFIADLMSSFDFYAVTHDWIITQVFTGLLSQSIWFMSGIFIYEAKTRKERVILFMGTALGCSLGSTLMLSWFKPLFNSYF